MSKSQERALLENGVSESKIMQVATIDRTGIPTVCHVWFTVSFEPDRLYFISRRDRHHAVNIRNDPRVAAGIVLEAPTELGDKVRGVTLTGTARELAPPDPTVAAQFLARWPGAAPALDQARANVSSTFSRLYEIAVTGWTLFDEVNFPDQPKITLHPL
jgi:nitroimidazol reductase NimA-like FMN-containing flavoprotein (pyridoxamine 5'-phosphate oxidase superfamily)